MLNFEHAWRFDSPGPIAPGVVTDISALIGRVAVHGSRKHILEHFKRFFANAAGITCMRSTDESWAETDLQLYMRQAAENAPLFIEAFFDACEALGRSGDFAVPDVARTNRVLAENEAGYEIDPPHLIARNPQAVVTVEARAQTLDEQAQEIIQKSLNDSEQLLSEGRHRQAVQEILWLLETVSTAFQGIDTGAGAVQGKYFNRIVHDLRRNHRGQSLEQILNWATALHGYLSSPTGGGVRHGTNLGAAVTTEANEARLFCNLIRSYISFLLAEHERLSGR